jgi:hypothetical protein
MCTNVEHSKDIGMIERRRCARFLFEPLDTLAVAGEFTRNNFDRDIAIEPRIARAIHLAHAAGANEADHFVRAKTDTGRQ